jgi:WD40 repeat protein/tRNA A-37 threonylcarbamoyl transferase component Bud32
VTVADAAKGTVDGVGALNFDAGDKAGDGQDRGGMGATVDSVSMDAAGLGATVDSVGSVGGLDGGLGATVDSVTIAADAMGATVDSVSGIGEVAAGGGIGATVDSVSSVAGSADVIRVAPSAVPLSRSAPQAKSGTPSKSSGDVGSSSLEDTLVIQSRQLGERKDDAPGKKGGPRNDYDLLKKLGEGGMGVVFLAKQQSIQREVALKMLKANATHQSTQREKFLAEAVITGDLEHPNIVPIYDLGRDESGAIFYAMKRVQGTPWEKKIKENTLQENLEILMKVADAVGFAHSKMVIHRDLKPENVMLGEFGVVLVMDWGLAITVGKTKSFAMGGTPAYMSPEMVLGPPDRVGIASDVYLLGAILYECVTGHRPHGGKTITECLMNASRNVIEPTPKTGELVDIALKAMATKPEDRYASVSDLQSAIRSYQSHTESISLAARAQEELDDAFKSDRYEAFARALFGFQEALTLWDGNKTAREGARDAALAYARCAQRRTDYELGLSLLDESIDDHRALADELRAAQRERDLHNQRLKTARRVGVGLVASILAIITGAFFWIRSERDEAKRQEVRANDARLVAEKAQEKEKVAKEDAIESQKEAVEAQKDEAEARKLAENAKKLEEYESYVAKIGLAASKIEENAFGRAASLLAECPESLRNWEWGRLQYLCDLNDATIGLESPLETLAVSPDGKRFATGGWSGDVWVGDFDRQAPPRKIVTGATRVFAVAFSPDGKRLAIGSNLKPEYLSIWDPESGAKVESLSGHTDAVLCIDWSKDGKRLLTGSYDYSVRLWDLASGQSVRYLQHDDWVMSVALSPDGQRFVSGSKDRTAIVWQSDQPGSGSPFLGHLGQVLAVAFSPDGKLVASGGDDGTILIWRPEKLAQQDLTELIDKSRETLASIVDVEMSGSNEAVRSLAFSADGTRLLSGGNDNVVRLWDLSARTPAKEFRGHEGRVAAAAFTPDGGQIISAGNDQLVKVWSIAGYAEIKTLGARVLEGHRDSILAAQFSPLGGMVVSASRDRRAIAWDLTGQTPPREFTEGHEYLAAAAIFLPGADRIATSAIDNSTRIWSAKEGLQIKKLSGTGTHASIAVAPDAKRLYTGSVDKTVRVWDYDGNEFDPIEGFVADVTALAVSPDEKTLLTGDAIGICRLIDLATGKELWESRSHTRGITSVAFVPGQEVVLTASTDQSVAVRNRETGEEFLRRVFKHPKPVTGLAVSRDGTRAVTACGDEAVRVWDVAASKELREIECGSAPTSVAISPDGKLMLVVTANQQVRMWGLESGEELSADDGSQGPLLDFAKQGISVWSADFAEDGLKILAVGGAEAHLWDLRGARRLVTYSPQSAVSSIAFSPGGDRFVTGSWDNAARVWDVASGTAKLKVGTGVHRGFVNAAAFSPDGTRLATASDDRVVVWDAASGEKLVEAEGRLDRITAIDYSPDGKQLLIVGDGKEDSVLALDADSLETLRSYRGHTQAVLCGKYSRDGRWIITGSDDNTARIWDAATGQLREWRPNPETNIELKLAAHTSGVSAVAFTPDGRRVLTGGKDMTAKLWDAQTGKEILTLTGQTGEITSVAVSPDGRYFLTASRDGTMVVWPSVPWTGRLVTSREAWRARYEATMLRQAVGLVSN